MMIIFGYPIQAGLTIFLSGFRVESLYSRPYLNGDTFKLMAMFWQPSTATQINSQAYCRRFASSLFSRKNVK
jgi:hypothetical protein